uniref:Kallikrein-6 n=1 Tax=Drosophila rhopaloa TaxID=1041015 RepID=A0A6P4FCG2_DRORH
MKLLLACLMLAIRGSFPQKLLDPNCVESPSGEQIYGGENADLLRHPWMVQIIQAGYHMCGGSLITSQFILTAAHCNSQLPIKVLLGGHIRGNPQYTCTELQCKLISKEIDVADMFVHPHYLEYHQHDIALILMAESVLFNAHIRPICMMQSSDVKRHSHSLRYVKEFKVTGWGKTESSESSSRLILAYLYHLDRKFCSERFMRTIGWPHICAYNRLSSTCIGDSGGPLSAEMTWSGKKRPFLFGLTSYGALGCLGPTVFTNVLPYTDWIEDTIQKHFQRTAILFV